MGRYAEKTTVSPDKSRGELERTLIRYGASQFIYGYEEARIFVGFRISNRAVKMVLPMPVRESEDYRVGYGSYRSKAAADRAFEQHIRQRWRALFIVVKAKLESVDSQIETFDEAFLPHLVIPSGPQAGQTVGQAMIPELARSIEGGNPPKLLEM